MDFLQDSGFSASSPTNPPVKDHLSKLLEVTPDGGGSSIFSEELIFDLGDLDDGDDNLEDKIQDKMDTVGNDDADSYPWMLQGSTSLYSGTNHFEFERNPFEGNHYNDDRTDLHEDREKSPIFNVNKTDQNQSWWFEDDNFSESPILTNMGSNLLLSSTSLKSFDDDEDLEMQNGHDFDFPEDFDLEYYDQLLLQGSLPSSLGSGSSSLDSVMANFGSLNLYDDHDQLQHRSTEEPMKVQVSGQAESLLVRNKPKQVKKRHFPNTSEEYRHKKMLLKMRKYQRERLAKMSVAEQERYRGRSRAYYWEKMQKWEPEKFREAILKRKGQLQHREQSLLLPKQ